MVGLGKMEKEIDLMAMHGISNPTALLGQEAVWQEVWSAFGIEKEELKDYFSGPAFLPWFRMGNINKYGGSLPQSWINHEKELQKKIISRMKELGMQPIAQTFSGYVPKIFVEKYPHAKVHTMKVWSGFDSSNGTYMLDPKDPLFKEIGKKYIENYRKLYGDAEFFLADPFNEMKPPVTKENKLVELAEYGEIIYNTIAENARNATWVMQGWLFGRDSAFWKTDAIQSFLSKVPKDKIIIQDYGEDRYPLWQKVNSFYGYNWQYGFVHNCGGTNPVFGDLKFYQDKTLELLNSSERGSLVGYGVLPEGIENNSVVYEYIYDIPWGAANINVDNWLNTHLKSRYGTLTPEIESAWKILKNSSYNVKYWYLRWKYQAGTYLHNKRPTSEIINFDEHPGTPDSLNIVVNTYLNELDKYNDSELYFYDLVEFSRHAIACKADKYLVEATKAYVDKNHTEGDRYFSICKDLLSKLDTLLLANNLSLSKWCNHAVSSPGTEDDKKLYLQNAKNQVTVWGGNNLHDYASKEWSGMVKDFYILRWKMYFDAMKASGKGFNETETREDIRKWEEEWASSLEIPQSNMKLNKKQYISIIKSCGWDE